MADELGGEATEFGCRLQFIGIDLAWAVDRNHAGAVVLRGDERGARFVTAAKSVKALTGVVEFVQKHDSESTVVAVDAPLIVNNTTGSRECELASDGSSVGVRRHVIRTT